MLASVAERIKAIVPGNRETKATWDESLRQLRGLVEEIIRREKFVVDALQLLNERLKTYEVIGGPLDVALKANDIESVRVALNGLDGKPDHSELLRKQVTALSRASSLQLPRNTFLSEHREARTVLQTVCSLSLDQSRINRERVAKEEQARLDALGDGYDSSHSLVVKRANAHVAQLEAMLTNIESATAESFQTLFMNFGQQLLAYEWAQTVLRQQARSRDVWTIYRNEVGCRWTTLKGVPAKEQRALHRVYSRGI